MKLNRRDFILFTITNITILFSVFSYSSEIRQDSKKEILKKILSKLNFKFAKNNENLIKKTLKFKTPTNKQKFNNETKKTIKIDNWIFKEDEIFSSYLMQIKFN